MMTLLVNCVSNPLWSFIKQKLDHKRRLIVIAGLVILLAVIILYYLPE
jgi:hypothetical protein